MTPYLLPRADALIWFLCRWESEQPLRTSLPADASPRERELLELALASWEEAGLGLRFDKVPEGHAAEIAISIADGNDAGRAGSATALCAVASRGEDFAARLVTAEVSLSRTNRDMLGRAVPLLDEEWLGAALHEIGHALGFQGHTRSGGIMVRNIEEVRRLGRRVLDGAPLEAPSVAALYRVPSGARLARVALPAGSTAAIDRLAELAQTKGYRGPLVQVGDIRVSAERRLSTARIAWWDEQGRSVGVGIPDLRETLRDPSRLEIRPDPMASVWLGPGFDERP